MKTQKYQVGDKLWFVDFRRLTNNKEVTILGVGKKWLYLDNSYRCDIKSLSIDAGNYSVLGRCFASRDVWEKQVSANRAWHNLEQKIIRMRCPENITEQQIIEAAILLGIGELAS